VTPPTLCAVIGFEAVPVKEIAQTARQYSDDHQTGQEIAFQPNAQVDAIGADVDIVLISGKDRRI
jgi:hypothetical protein